MQASTTSLIAVANKAPCPFTGDSCLAFGYEDISVSLWLQSSTRIKRSARSILVAEGAATATGYDSVYNRALLALVLGFCAEDAAGREEIRGIR